MSSILRAPTHSATALAIALLPLVSACTSYVASFRTIQEFPEYGGYLPIDENGCVQPDLVVPTRTSDGRDEWTAPATAAEAEQRIAHFDPGTRPSATQLLAAPVVVPLLVGLLFIADILPESDNKAESPFLAEHGAPIELHVTDPEGRPVAGVRVREFASSVALPDFSAGPGRRSLVAVGERRWTPNPTLVREMTRQLPIRLGRTIEVEYKDSDGHTGKEGHRIGEFDRDFAVSGDDSGFVRYTSLAAAGVPLIFSGTDLSGAPTSTGAHLLLWAPGFEPAVVDVGRVEPSTKLRLEATLQPAPDAARVRAAYERLIATVDSISTTVDVSFFSVTVDGARLQEALRTVRSLEEDTSLPAWLRANARAILEDLARTVIEITGLKSSEPFSFRGARAEANAEAKRVLHSLGPRPALGAFSVHDDPPNPWVITDELARWRSEATKLGMDPAAEGPRRAAQQTLLAQARELLAEGEALDATLPDLEPLRAALALAEENRSAALEHAWLLDSSSYFGFFYGALRDSS